MSDAYPLSSHRRRRIFRDFILLEVLSSKRGFFPDEQTRRESGGALVSMVKYSTGCQRRVPEKGTERG